MEELYNFNRHTHHVCIYLEESGVICRIFRNLHAGDYASSSELETKIIYNKQKTDILCWGNTESFKPEEYCIVYDDFMNGLYYLFKKGMDTWDEDDIFFTEAVSEFLGLIIENKIKNLQNYEYIESLDSLHYTFIVPSEWEMEIREDLIRPIFIQAGLISKKDHNDRLLFVSDLESICYYLSEENKSYSESNYSFKKYQNTVVCRCNFIDEETAMIRLDFIQTVNTLFDIPKSMLYPKVIRSDALSITSNTIKYGIKKYLEYNMFLAEESVENKNIIEIVVDKIYHNKFEIILEKDYAMSMEKIYANHKTWQSKKHWKLTERLHTSSEEWGLDDIQTMFLNAISVIDILRMIDKKFYKKIECMFSNNHVKEYELLIIVAHPSDMKTHLYKWLQLMQEYSISILNNMVPLDIQDSSFYDIDGASMIYGVSLFVNEIIQNSSLHCAPCILPNKNQIKSSSIFHGSRPEAIINIDISLKSTLISYSILNEDGAIVQIFDNNFFLANEYLPSLETFYNVTSNKTTLRTKEKFISFAERYLWTNSKSLCVDVDILVQIEAILNKDRIVSTQNQKYIEAFLLMYVVHIKKIISEGTNLFLSKKSKLRLYLESLVLRPTKKIKIGYAITIDKIFLDNIIGSKEKFRELIYRSRLLKKNDDSKKLRIVTKGEEILSLIQPMLKLQFPVRSNFVLAQLHESHIQLTLNQVVTVFDVEDKQQEAIIIEDKIIHIQNIYESLCLSMWNNLIQDNNLIQLCSIHSEENALELFSLTTKIEFTANFKRYISKNILNSKSDLKFNMNSVNMNRSCNCKVKFTMNDVIEISFRPFLKDITTICMGSLINKGVFGNYKNIDYHFSLIHFNQNQQFLDIIDDILKEESEDFNPWQGINTICLIIPALPAQLFLPTLNFQPYLYKGFVIGTLRQTFTENCALRIRKVDSERVYSFENYNRNKRYMKVYTTNRIDKKTVGIEANDGYFPLYKKGDIMSNVETTKIFYLEQPSSSYGFHLNLAVHAYKTYGALNRDGTIASDNETWDEISDFTSYYYDQTLLPLIVVFKPPGYSSTPQITARMVGREANKDNTTNIEKGELNTINDNLSPSSLIYLEPKKFLRVA